MEAESMVNPLIVLVYEALVIDPSCIMAFEGALDSFSLDFKGMVIDMSTNGDLASVIVFQYFPRHSDEPLTFFNHVSIEDGRLISNILPLVMKGEHEHESMSCSRPQWILIVVCTIDSLPIYSQWDHV